jgi:hypothetical protein
MKCVYKLLMVNTSVVDESSSENDKNWLRF